MIGRNRITTIPDGITLQYANGKSVARRQPTDRFQPYVGFHIEVGRDPDLDTLFVRETSLEQIEMKHQRPGGAEIVRHWDLGEQVQFFPITSGPVAATVSASVSDRYAAATAAAGIGLRWSSNERSRMAIRGYLDVLVGRGMLRLVQFTVRSRMTDVLLAALVDHARICTYADAVIDRGKHLDEVTFHEIALPLGAGAEEEWGTDDTTTVVPFVSQHPANPDLAYLRSVWRPEPLHEAALREWERIQRWAQDYALSTPVEESV